MTHTVKMQFTFTAAVMVEADTPEAAEAIAMREFWCVGPACGDGESDAIKSWALPPYPEKRILKD